MSVNRKRKEELRERESLKKSPLKEIVSLLILGIATYILISLYYFSPLEEESHLTGIFGYLIASTFYSAFGICSFLFVIYLYYLALLLLRGRKKGWFTHIILYPFTIIVGSTIVSHIFFGYDNYLFNKYPGGGSIGKILGEFISALIGKFGTVLFTLLLLTVIFMLMFNFSIGSILNLIEDLGRKTIHYIERFVEYIYFRLDKNREDDRVLKENRDSIDLDYDKDGIGEDKEDGEEEIKSIKVIIPNRVHEKREGKEEEEIEEIKQQPQDKNYKLPPLDLLSSGVEEEIKISHEEIVETAKKLKEALLEYKIKGEIREVHPGPVVTLYEFRPESGTKLSNISSRKDEIAMRLEVEKVRIVAPIPGKNAVGIEVPNPKRQVVRLGELLRNKEFTNPKYILPLALGKDITGEPYYTDLAKMPHLLIAGTTGSGKSVAINSMILSLLYRFTPNQLKLILVDPKVIELGIYEGIPHLMTPVVTDMKKADAALKWAVEEMERRYDLFAQFGVRNILGYNKKVEKELMGEAKIEPYLVIIIDELADLMMVAARDVEISIARLAQKARAAGIHLILATQRPSTDVLSGTIRNNLPARISFRLSSATDSRVVLDRSGAETLLGSGDMLIRPPGTVDLFRVHGAYISDEEVHNVVEFWKSQGTPQYNEEILKSRSEDNQELDDDEEYDELYEKAVILVSQLRYASVSIIQRKLKIGYNRAARIIERMEKEGIVGPANGAKPREVLIEPQ